MEFDCKEGKRGSDTGKAAEKGVARMRFERKEVERCSDTGNFGEKGVSRMGWGFFIKMEQISR